MTKNIVIDKKKLVRRMTLRYCIRYCKTLHTFVRSNNYFNYEEVLQGIASGKTNDRTIPLKRQK